MTRYVYAAYREHIALVSECWTKREATALVKALRGQGRADVSHWFLDKPIERAIVPWPALRAAIEARASLDPSVQAAVMLPAAKADPISVRRRRRPSKPKVPALARITVERSGNIPRKDTENRPKAHPLAGLSWLKKNDPSHQKRTKAARRARAKGSRIHSLHRPSLR